MTTGRHLALFDFDGTLTDRDTMLAFVVHCRGWARVALGLAWLSPMLAAYAVGAVRNDRAKAILLGHFLGGQTREAMTAWGTSFAERVETYLRPGASERLAWHQGQGHDVVLVSASLDVWLRSWCARRGLELLCTRAAWEGDRFTGALDGPNCHGPEKERRIRASLDLTRYETIYAYGDSSGDTEMLALAHQPSFKPFRGRAAPANPAAPSASET